MSIAWSIITVTYNSAAKLDQFWSGFEASEDVEWIVVDNQSTDASKEVARKLGARVVDSGGNLGFSRANNVGASEALGKYLLFANPDVELRVADLPRLAELLDRCGGLLAPQLQFIGGDYQYNGRGWPFLNWKVRNRLGRLPESSDYLPQLAPGEVSSSAWLTGAAIASTAETFRKIGGWESSYFLYNEDVDLGLMARFHGFHVGIANEIAWVHGWAREPAAWKLRPLVRELRSTWRFYRRWPVFLIPVSRLTSPYLAARVRAQFAPPAGSVGADADAAPR